MAQSPASPKQVRLETSAGTVLIELDTERAPLSAANFLQYVKAGHYDGTVFHRVIRGFMVQGGGFDSSMKQKPTQAAIRNEANNGLKNQRYTLAMARTSDPHSATAQFFINTVDNGFLDFKAENVQGWGYAVFGRVVEGTDVVDRIEGVKTGRKGMHDDVPLEEVRIERASEVA
jgi:peptidyl-prolyl cis-trans isomerase B (cyclophilin B)